LADTTSPQAHSQTSPVSDDASYDTTTLSLVARRRLQKRLYMRRKRAERTGTTVATDPGKLKPGRKDKVVVSGGDIAAPEGSGKIEGNDRKGEDETDRYIS
jgi:hypothetical protein